MNAASIFGRLVPGLVADRVGRYNVIISSTSICTCLILGLWPGGGGSNAFVIGFAILYGFFTAPGYSLTPVCVSQLCSVKDYASQYGAGYAVVSLATLGGIPISGLVMGSGNGNRYQALIFFCGVAYGLSVLLITFTRVISCIWKPWTML